MNFAKAALFDTEAAAPYSDADHPKIARLLAAALRPKGRLVIVHFIGADRVNAVHRSAANPILHQDRLPPRDAMATFLAAAGLTADWAVDDDLGYLVRGRVP